MTLEDAVWEDGTVKAIDVVHPSDLASSDGSIFVPNAKIVLALDPHSDGWIVAAWQEGPKLALVARVTSLEELGRRRRAVTLESGLAVHWTSARGCGCGSTLKAFRPWAPDAQMVGAPRPKVA